MWGSLRQAVTGHPGPNGLFMTLHRKETRPDCICQSTVGNAYAALLQEHCLEHL